ncbi:Mitochondrial inner membrane i-AAA protease supercomplex subunit MGR3 [Spathaspora sp. JA1]|nr:Mitochondrial inner membrane i-AAA protease supercomplex subunit MGR3 [Spathaspora sp. JA1]
MTARILISQTSKRLIRNKYGFNPFLVATRFNSSQYNYNYNQSYNYNSPPTGSSIFKKFIYVTLGFVGLTGAAYYIWWPKHTFPSSVAKILRKGLWAESDKGEHDYQLALKYYLQALDHCQEIGLDPLSDEYTGIQLKVAEMYERLNMKSDASFIYNEIATLYLTVLTAGPDSNYGTRLNRDLRRHLIQKDLRIAIKLVEMNRENPQLCKAILVTHLIIAQDEVNKVLTNPKPLSLVTRANTQDDVNTYTATLDNDTIVINGNHGEEFRVKKTPEVWEPFTNEFFNAMDLLSAICISSGDLAMASKVKISMSEAMLLADVEPSKMLLSQCNLGSLLYMQAEELEAQEISLRRKFSELTGIDYEKLKTETLLENQTDKEMIQNTLKEKVSVEDQELYEQVVSSKKICIQLAIKSFESVLEFAKTVPQEIIKQHNEINETVGLATYGLGVVNLHLGAYDKAERLLRESRVRCKQCNYSYLIPEIERELGKLFDEKKNIKQGINRKDDLRDIEMDILLK